MTGSPSDTRQPLATGFLPAAVWQAQAHHHAEQIETIVAPIRARRGRHEAHPIIDFLFTYYTLSFAKLAEWHPPPGTALEATDPLPTRFATPPYRRDAGRVFADPATLTDRQRERLRWIHDLLVATRDRTPNFVCHGLHEWAMVYRASEIRHAASTSLRLPQSDIDHLVESRPVCCSHFDAFRFFPPAARPLNRLQPSLDSRPAHEQPACVHANMDLYKWAYKTMPWIGSALLLDCFRLALQLRELDMRASPYDLTNWGCVPIPVETPEGRAEYERLQQTLAAAAAPLRQALIGVLQQIVFPL